MKAQHPSFKEAQTTLEFLLGPIKIKDGLFMGDQFAAKDIEFIVSNKVTHVINTVSKAIPNLYERFGVQYLSVHWTEKEENIFDRKNNAINAIFTFVEEAMEQGQSCLIHSLHGKSRATAVLCAYLMRKYSWSLNKCLELINTKKEGLEIRNNYLIQMQELQRRMAQSTKMTSSWNQSKTDEDMTLANTYHNSKKIEYSLQPAKKQAKKKLAWSEKLVQKTTTAAQGTTSYSSAMGRIKEQSSEKKDPRRLKSILKGCPNQLQDQTADSSQFKVSESNNTVNNINGNIVHVTVNNFITTEKKGSGAHKTAFNTRPYSSDNKEREKKSTAYDPKPNKLFGYDAPMVSNVRGAYESKLGSKVGSMGSRATPKKTQIRNPNVYDRPSSANTSGDRRKGRGVPGQQMMVTGMSGKKRFPSSTAKEDLFRFK